ncbi:heat-inducible transcriptional repressor HrcA [Pseudogemmatithrix spongiicola]|uniref:Heat-inducible transcription repressor HrcA n=1 Tax=Pseudogemmatithrix spongiicola TaxID=3062599 RepID=A0AA49Q817_9BACT|nr:heat-inducible transcriptional repressor HrcA [Gemmatimonadaceae bacterium 'strain 138']WKW15341.1 heat-inducible transcriptional repressor HrcA [Gemmatimonadaceae bacterium 'strain 318']
MGELNTRERQVLEAVIQSYVETAEPAGSRTISRRFGLGVSPATIRNTMADLEEKGFLYHPHTSAGRIPTDKAYRFYVDGLMHQGQPLPAQSLAVPERDRLAEQIGERGSAIETILRRAAQSLGVLTQELGVALGPRLDQTVLAKLELVRMSSDRLILVLTLRGGAVRTIFIEIAGEIADNAIAEVQQVLNERLGGLSLAEIRTSLGERLRDAAPTGGATELLNIFVQEGEQLFDVAVPADEDAVVLGQASVLAEKPEFASGNRLKQLIALTETRSALAGVLRQRTAQPGVSISIGDEHGTSLLGGLTLVTAEYRAGSLTGVIGVIGPTRMPYEKVISLVSHTSSLVTDLLG